MINIYTHFISDKFYFDSKYWILGIILTECFEIIIPFYALLLYGGINLLDKHENVLSQERYVFEGDHDIPVAVKVFSIFFCWCCLTCAFA